MMQGPTATDVLKDLIRHPVRHFVRGWNWKSATISSITRAAIFFTVNLPAGLDAGVRAMFTEMIFRAMASGVLGSATQAFRAAAATMSGTLTALLVIPAIGHLAEYTVHRLAGTARLGESIAVSIGFSVLTTAFNLFAMRRGALIVGDGRQSLLADMRRMPGLIGGFIKAVVIAAISLIRGRGNRPGCMLRRST